MMGIYSSLEFYAKNSRQCINLVASENILPDEAMQPYKLDLVNRYIFKSEQRLYFPGRDELYRLEISCCNLVAELLNAQYASLKPVSGLNAMTCVLAIFTQPGSIVYSINPKYGGHHVTKFMLESMGRVSRYIPFSEEKQDIDFEAFEREINEFKPSLVYIDIMNILHDVDVARIKSVIGNKRYLVYDASHVMALIMGRHFRNPLKFGADILIGTTHKTIPGPHKAIFATDNPILYRIFNLRNGAFISSQHPADVYALGIVLEGMKSHMQMYAKNIIDNARTLASSLDNFGLPVFHSNKGYTDTHQIWIGATGVDLYPFIDQLMRHRIITNGLEIPYIENYGIRLGVQEVTFCGLKEKEIEELAYCIGQIYAGVDLGLDDRINGLIESMNKFTYFELER